jgi:hippurate hydrolase
MHNWPGTPLGAFEIKAGPLLAATDEFTATITGRGGHGAKPNETIDPTVAAAQVVLALQTIVSRNVKPMREAVVSVTSFETSSNAFNIIPERVLLKGTCRTLDDETHDLVEKRVVELIEGIAAAHGCSAEVDYFRNYPATVNHEVETGYAIEAARKVAGDCLEAEVTMGGEDFSYMLNARPGAYIFVGNGESAKLHSPDYNFNDEAIPFGCSWFVEIVESRLKAA